MTDVDRRQMLKLGAAAGGAIDGLGDGRRAAPSSPAEAVVDTGSVTRRQGRIPGLDGTDREAVRPAARSPAPFGARRLRGAGARATGIGGDPAGLRAGETRKARGAHLRDARERRNSWRPSTGVPPDALYGYDDWAGVKANSAIDAVYVVTPNALHREAVVAAAGAGKHVLCEKPMATSSADCEAMIAACSPGATSPDDRLPVPVRAQ